MKPSHSARGGFATTLLLFGVACVALVGYCIAQMVTVSRDASALRHAILSVDGAAPRLVVQGSMGPVLLATARHTLRWFDMVPTDARIAMAPLRSASVSVHQWDSTAARANPAAWSTAARQTMMARGWMATVSVVDGDEWVQVFTRPAGVRDRDLQVCVAVVSGQELVVAEARLAMDDLEQLTNLSAWRENVSAAGEKFRL
jgi:hypothetical protein